MTVHGHDYVAEYADDRPLIRRLHVVIPRALRPAGRRPETPAGRRRARRRPGRSSGTAAV